MAITQFGKIHPIVFTCVEQDLKKTGLANIDFSKRIIGSPPDGYIATVQEFKIFCATIASCFNHNSGNSLILSKEWREKYQGEDVTGFISAVAIEAEKQAKGQHGTGV
jgi:hypothetical protein